MQVRVLHQQEAAGSILHDSLVRQLVRQPLVAERQRRDGLGAPVVDAASQVYVALTGGRLCVAENGSHLQRAEA